MRNLLGAICLFLAMAGVVHAQATPPSSQTPKIESMTSIPVTAIQAVKTSNEIFFMSQDGRYVFRGDLIDTWHKKKLESIADIKYSTNHINVDVMGLNFEKMNTISVGSGKEIVVVFVDPTCMYCKKFLMDAKTKFDKYTFKIVVVPALGDRANVLSKQLFCSSDKSNAFDSLVQNKLNEMPQQAPCDISGYDLTLTVAQLFGIRSVPYFIAPDGRYRAGAGPEFWEWLAKKE